jgi:hypothetical protein
MNGKRSRLIIIAAAGTLTLATAISAAAATLPAGSAAGAADAHMLTQKVHIDTLSLAQRQVSFDTTRYSLAQQQTTYESPAARAAVARAAAQKAAAAKAAAAKAAAAKAAAAKAAAAKAAAQQAAQQQAAAQQATQQQAAQQTTAQQPAASAPSGSPQQIAQQMLSQFGWSSGQFSCLQPLWALESGWNIYASNPSSGAYGIPQALPGSKMASAGPDWQSDAATQIRWGLTYIQGSYGSPCAAWSHEEADGWY